MEHISGAEPWGPWRVPSQNIVALLSLWSYQWKTYIVNKEFDAADFIFVIGSRGQYEHLYDQWIWRYSDLNPVYITKNVSGKSVMVEDRRGRKTSYDLRHCLGYPLPISGNNVTIYLIFKSMIILIIGNSSGLNINVLQSGNHLFNNA